MATMAFCHKESFNVESSRCAISHLLPTRMVSSIFCIRRFKVTALTRNPYGIVMRVIPLARS
uniref:Uncharacterized protein n=1 Tax=Babesia bovis TaxID=5865 RepID=S6BLP9_BABBO|nr:hypothetical protein [Babesia bovis]